MNIEEATEMLKRIYVTRFNTSSIYDNVPNVNLAIETLLKAYEKEKEKNKKLEKELENQQKGMKNWEEICDEQEEDISLKNNKILDLEFEIKKQSKEIEELRNEVMEKELIIDGMKEERRIAIEEIQEQYYVSKDKIKEKIKEYNKKCDECNFNKSGICKELKAYNCCSIQSVLELLKELIGE